MHSRTLVLIALVGLVGPVAAQPKKPPTATEKKQADEEKKQAEEKKQKAAEHFERAVRSYNFGNYDDAVREYQAAFDLTADGLYLFNIGQTYRAKGDKKLALEFYKKYIELDPKGEGAASSRSHVETLEREIRAEVEAAEQQRQAAAEAERKRQADAETARRLAAETAAREAKLAADRNVADAEAARDRSTKRSLRLAGLITGGSGIAALAFAGYFGLRARSLSDEASDTRGMWTEDAQDTVDRAETSERVMLILLGVGGAATITGGVLYFLGSRPTKSSTETRTAIMPGVVRGGAGIFVTGSL